MALRAGEVRALVGENGAGKSTLIKVLTGVHQPDSGEITYRGVPVRFARPRDAQAAGISTIYQEVNLVPLLSVARNLFLGREPKNRLRLIDFARMHRQAAEILAALRHRGRRPTAVARAGSRRAADGRDRTRGVRRPSGRHHGRADLVARTAGGRATPRGGRAAATRRRRGRLYLASAGRGLPRLRPGDGASRWSPRARRARGRDQSPPARVQDARAALAEVEQARTRFSERPAGPEQLRSCRRPA